MNASAAPRDITRDTQTLQQIGEIAQSGDTNKAIEMARGALADGLIHPMLLNMRSYWLDQQGKKQEALADLRRAISMAPEDPLLRNAYGLQLARTGRHFEALAEFEQATVLAPDFSHAHFNLGWSLEQHGRLDDAKRAYETTLALAPDHADALARLAGLAARRGDRDEAYAMADQALAIMPDNNLAWAAKATAAIARHEFDVAEEALQAILTDAGAQDYDRASAQSLMGDMRHAQQRYAEAFVAYKTGNGIRREEFAPRYSGPHVESPCTFAVWLAEYFERVAPEKWLARRSDPVPAATGGTTSHVFLVGFPRSGTTLLENVLASNPRVVTLEEKETLNDAFQAYLVTASARSRLSDIREPQLSEFRERYWQRVKTNYGVDVEGKVFVDKQPLGSVKLPLVAKLFPDAKILFALRDPRDVVLSCFRRQFALNPAMFELLTLEGGARFYSAVMRISMIYKALLGLSWYELRHETLVEDFEAEARRACAFIGAEWSPEMHGFAERARTRTIATPSSTQVIKGLNREGMAQWRHYATEMAPILPTLQPWIDKFGYPHD